MSDKKISQLPVATTSTGPDLYTLVQGGVNKSITLTSLGIALGGAASSITQLIGDITATGPGVTVAHLTAVTNSTLTTLSALQLPYSQLTGSVPTWNQNTTGTAANITATSNNTLTTLSSLTTASSLSSVGTITSGTWNGTAIAIANGGTGQTSAAAAYNAISPMTTTGDMEYESSPGVAARLPIGTTGQILTVAAGVPAWSNPLLFTFVLGSGGDGALSLSSGTVTLTRDMYYSSVSWTVGSTGILNTNNWRVFISGSLDLTNLPSGGIQNNGTNGNPGLANGTGGGSASGALAGGFAAGEGSNPGGAGQLTNGSAGSNGLATGLQNGNLGNIGGNGGAGASGTGGLHGNQSAAITAAPLFRLAVDFIRGVTLIGGGSSGAGGGGGGGDGTVKGGGGASGGAGASPIAIFCNTLIRASTTSASGIQSNGGNGANGGSPASGNAGGGGGSGGGGGGWVYLVYAILSGPVETIGQVNGGAGGNGVVGSGTGVSGAGGAGGYAGRVTLVNMTTGVITDVLGGAGTAATGSTGGPGATNNITI